MGILFSLWGYFTGLLEWNLFGSAPIYLSPWTLLFAFPYLFYGVFSLYSCFMRYDLVYLGQKPVNARTFGYVITILMIILGICSLLFFLIVDTLGSFPLAFIHISPDIMLLLTSGLCIFVLFRYGFFGGRPSIAEISAATRVRPEPISRSPSRPRARASASSRSSTSSSTPTQSRSTSTSQTRSSATTRSSSDSRTSRPTSTSRIEEKDEKSKEKIKKLIKYLKPKGSISVEDFRCIFCFAMPEYPADKGRGIVVCPKCKHPAHADEFRMWLRNSNLCSRCDQVLPADFRRDPQVISVKTYVAVMKILLKRGK